MNDSIESQISDILNTYSEDIKKTVERVGKNVAKDCVNDVKSRATSIFKGEGGYAKGFKSKKLKEGAYVVYNATKPGLTHLLENSHITGKGTGRYAGRPHIKPAEQKAVKEYEDKLREELNRG